MEMLGILKKNKVDEINIWHDNLPFSSDWLKFLKDFIDT